MSVCANSRCIQSNPSPNGRCLTCNSLVAGRVIRDRYLVKDMVSRGGFGATYLIEDLDCFNEFRILKELRPLSVEKDSPTDSEDSHNSSARRETAERLFKREAETLLKLNHPGIPKLYAYFVQDDFRYLLQEYIHGHTMAEVVDNLGRTLNEQETRDFLQELAQILGYLHQQDPPIIHRDIKPQNLMRHKDGRLLLIDFGAVCRAANKTSKSPTLIGSPGYAAPEQILGQPVTQSDLYSSGATVVRLLTGIHPTKLTKQRTEKLDWERHVTVSRPFVDLINSLLIRDPLRRLQSTELLLESLREMESYPSLSQQQSINSLSQDPPTATAIVNTGQSATSQNYRSAVASIITAIYKTEEICEGSLSLTPLPVLLFRCYQKNLTGAISLRSTDKTKTIYFDQGSIVFATSSQPEDRLGERLFRQGRISSEEFKHATTFVDQTSQRMGTALLQLGIIAIEEFVPIVVDHISSIVYSAFEWIDAQYKFEAITTPDEAIKMPFSTADIIFEGIRRLDNMDLIQQWLGDFDRPLKTTTDPLLLYQAVSLTPHEAFIVSRIDTAMSIEELLSMGGLPEEETLKTVAALLSIRMLEISDDSQIHSKLLGADPVSRILELPNPLPQDFDFSTAAVFCYEVEGKLRSLETADAYQTLEISKNATERDITDAYNQLARKFHPDRNSQLLNYNLTLRSDLEKIFSCLTQAYQSLKENRSKVGQYSTTTVSNPKVERRVASLTYNLFDELVEKGKRAYELGLYQEAKENFERAYKQNPGSAEINFNLARTIAHLPGGFDLAEKQFYKAIELAPENADYYAEFGLFLKRFSLDALAEAMFRNCLRIAPDHPIAKRSLS